jgi:hypothetical protein
MSSSSCAGTGLFGGKPMRNLVISANLSAFMTICQTHSLVKRPKLGKFGSITAKIDTTKYHHFTINEAFLS